MMRQTRLAAGLIGAGLAALWATSGIITGALAQEGFTACVSKKGKIKRLAPGNEPLRNCKGKQFQIEFPSAEKTNRLMDDMIKLERQTLDLMNKDDELMSGLVALQSQINDLQSQLDNLAISSLIGGDIDFSQQVGSFSEVAYMGMFGSTVVAGEENVTQNIGAAGILTSLFVRSDAPGEDNSLEFTLRIRNSDTPLSCTMAGTGGDCSVTDACVQVDQGDLISLRVDYVVEGDPTPVFNVRWNSRFVENGKCPDA